MLCVGAEGMPGGTRGKDRKNIISRLPAVARGSVVDFPDRRRRVCETTLPAAGGWETEIKENSERYGSVGYIKMNK